MIIKLISNIFSRNLSNETESSKDFILMVTTEYPEGGYGSHWYGWSRNLYLTKEDALDLKSKLENKYYDVEIIKIN